MTKGLVLISYGMGGSAIEWWSNGLRLLTERCKAAGLDTAGSPYNWNDIGPIVSAINRAAPNVPIGVVGASLGGNEATDIASRVTRKIAYLCGFQTSNYGVHVGVPANVVRADNFYNPGIIGWLRTLGGLGSSKWFPAKGNVRTIIRNIPRYQSHPDDWGAEQDIAFSQLHKLLEVTS